ncbi:MAG: hypothetical protein J4N87_03230 [Chloroflexi bacterium]|jgi:hypothetical protein|nr:hypothetical protein [Chloroflexota bacterium]
MAGPKETYEVQLNPDQMAFIRSMKDEFKIADESKTIRVVIDYLMTTKNVHKDVFGKNRCLRCE